MKKNSILMILLLTGIALAGQSGGVEVDITDIVAEWGGTVRIGLFEQGSFPKEGEAIAMRDWPVRGIKTTVIFENIPVGNYAIAAYQDVNGDGKLNRTIYGQPTEPYAFSNNVFGRFGPPKFSAAAFKVENSAPAKLDIRLKE